MTLKPKLTFTTATPDRNTEFYVLLFQYLANQQGYTVRYTVGWSLSAVADLNDLDKVGTRLATLHGPTGVHQIVGVHPDGALFYAFKPYAGHFELAVASKSADLNRKVEKQIRKVLPERPRLSEKEEVSVSFWSLTGNGARVIERTVGITPWDRVKHNYTTETEGALQNLMVDFKPNKAGQLILWYGAPGTGKTHALRALAWEWRKWCSMHYITDPEQFFGMNAAYMLDVILLRSDDVEPDDEGVAANRWRLLILEDSGELMVPDAKSQTGQGLSRLLNVVDGLIGQGLRLMVLVTTNEILKKLHPAVARPGRCAARIEFGEFSKAQAAHWLTDRNINMTPSDFRGLQTVSLAELYSRIGDTQTVNEVKDQQVGFAS